MALVGTWHPAVVNLPHCYKVSLEPSLLQVEESQLSQPFLTGCGAAAAPPPPPLPAFSESANVVFLLVLQEQLAGMTGHFSHL